MNQEDEQLIDRRRFSMSGRHVKTVLNFPREIQVKMIEYYFTAM